VTAPKGAIAELQIPETGQEFRAGWLIRGLLTFLSLIFLIPSLAMTGDDRAAIAGWVMASLTIAGIVFIWWQQSGLRLIIFPDRIEKRGRIYNKTLRFAELEKYVYVPQQRNTAYGYGAGGLLGMLIVAAVEAATRGNQAFPPPIAIRLTGAGGVKLFVSNIYSGHVPLIQKLTAMSTDALVPRVLAAYHAGQTVTFGKRLTVQREAGLSYRGVFGEKKLPLAALDRAALIEGNRFVLRHQGRVWARFLLSQLPNVFVLIALINEQRGAQQAGGQVSPGVAPPSPGGAIQ
jgi:hypothetical protein